MAVANIMDVTIKIILHIPKICAANLTSKEYSSKDLCAYRNIERFLPSGNLKVPVFLSLNVLASGLAAPFGRPKLAAFDVFKW